MQLFKNIALFVVLAAYAVNAQTTSVVTVPGYTATGATVTFPAQVTTVVLPPPAPPADTNTSPAGTGSTAAGPGTTTAERTTAAGPAPAAGTTGTAASASSVSGRCFPASATTDK